MKKTASAVKDAANATKKWVVEHKDTILEVAVIAGAIVAGICWRIGLADQAESEGISLQLRRTR